MAGTGFTSVPTSRTGMAALAAQAIPRQDGGQGIPTRPLGGTGEQVSILCLGGAHLGRAAKDDGEAQAIKMAHAAVDNGVTFWDNAWAYHDGYAEEFMGKALKGRREKVFLMTKNSGRDEKFARQCLEDSLRRMQTDYIDLWQFHDINYDNDPDWVFERGGLRVAIEAQKAGKVRHIGFTGHKHPGIHLNMLGEGLPVGVLPDADQSDGPFLQVLPEGGRAHLPGEGRGCDRHEMPRWRSPAKARFPRPRRSRPKCVSAGRLASRCRRSCAGTSRWNSSTRISRSPADSPRCPKRIAKGSWLWPVRRLATVATSISSPRSVTTIPSIARCMGSKPDTGPLAALDSPARTNTSYN